MQEELILSFYENKDLERAAKMAAYMKDQFSFLGIPRPKRNELQKSFIRQARKEKLLDWEFVFRLWDLPEREFQYLALDYLIALTSSLSKADMDRLTDLIVKKSWWDTVDSLAANPIGTLCVKEPELVQSHILNWTDSDNIWLVRTAILFQLKHKEKTDKKLLASIIIGNSSSREFFINKAIGWALREYSKTDKEWVKEFIDSNPLHSLSVREARKYL